MIINLTAKEKKSTEHSNKMRTMQELHGNLKEKKQQSAFKISVLITLLTIPADLSLTVEIILIALHYRNCLYLMFCSFDCCL